MINVALPKGRLGERAYEAFASAGYDCPAILEKNRRLTFENREKGVRYFWVKPSDVSIYVERGAADVGIAGRTLRVATKFPHITAEHYTAKSRDIDIIKLNGSIELAPILGLSDVIVDIVETGKTLLENHLAPLETIVDISAWLISSRVSYQFKHQEIAAMQAALARKL